MYAVTFPTVAPLQTVHAQERTLERLRISPGQIQQMLEARAYVSFGQGDADPGRIGLVLFSPPDDFHVLIWLAAQSGRILTAMPFSFQAEYFRAKNSDVYVDRRLRRAKRLSMRWLMRLGPPMPLPNKVAPALEVLEPLPEPKEVAPALEALESLPVPRKVKALTRKIACFPPNREGPVPSLSPPTGIKVRILLLVTPAKLKVWVDLGPDDEAKFGLKDIWDQWSLLCKLKEWMGNADFVRLIEANLAVSQAPLEDLVGVLAQLSVDGKLHRVIGLGASHRDCFDSGY